MGTKTNFAECVTYFRVSSQDQRERGSIARQDQLIPALVRQRNLRVVAEYRDDGCSGRTITGRQGMKKLLADLPGLRPKPQYIVFLRADRFGRPADWDTLMELVNAAPRHKVNLLYGREDSLTGELQATVVAHNDKMELTRFQAELVQAAAESERKGRDSRQGNFSNLLRGRWPFGQRPFGWLYDRTEHRFMPVPDQIDTLRLIYQRAAAGVGTPKIAQELRRRGVLLPRAAEADKMRKRLAAKWPGGECRWDQSAIRRLLTREYHYTGTMQYNVGERYDDLLKAYRQGGAMQSAEQDCLTPDGYVEFTVKDAKGQSVVDKATWQKARDHVDRRAKRHGGQRCGEAEAFLFGPFLRCECGGSIRANTQRQRLPVKGEVEYRYYICRFHAADTDRDGRPACSAPPLRADFTDSRLWTMLLEWVSHPSILLDKLLADDCADGADPDQLKALLADKEKEKAQHERSRSKWLDLFAEDSIDKGELKLRSRADAAEIERLAGEVETLQGRLADSTGRACRIRDARKSVGEYEKAMTAAGEGVRRQMDALDWHKRRAFLQRILGTGEIVLGWRPVASIRSIMKRRGGKVAADEFIRRWCILPPTDKTGGEGLFVAGALLPVNPAEIVDALTCAGVRPVLASKSSALA